jgi:aspartyl-tRNA synthetase
VKCFRDEDLRSDRQPEFTQIDVEMSFIEREDIFKLTEGLISRLWKGILDIDITTPFMQMTFKEAMERFGSDKPDIRFGLELKSINTSVSHSEFKVFSDAITNDGEVAALNAVGCASYSRKQIDELTELTKKYGAKGLAWIKLVDGQVNSPIAKFLTEQELNSIFEITGAKDGDLILIAADKWLRAYTVLGALRLEIAKQTKILEAVQGQFSFHWVIDFPLLEFDTEENRYVAIHHPFTSPMDEDIHLLDSAPEQARAKAYDLVVNGAELGGGSIRIHNGEIQNKMFNLLGFTTEEAESKFGFLLQALKYGAPPHGGVAFGLDRIVMTLAGIDNIRDVIAFPKTTSGLSLMDGSPSYVEDKQLNELGIRVVQEK